MVPQVKKLDCTGAVHHRQEPLFNLGHSPCPHTQTFDTAAISLRNNGSHPHNTCKLHGLLLIYWSQTDGRLSWP